MAKLSRRVAIARALSNLHYKEMNIYDTYGFKSKDLEKVKEAFEEVVKVTLETHESDYMGGIYYFHGQTHKENYTLKSNYSDEEGWTEEGYKELGVILYISRSQRSDELRNLLLNSFLGDILFIERIVMTGDRIYQKYQYMDGKDKLVFESNLNPR